MNIVYAANDNYAPLAGVSLISLFENNKTCQNITAYILDDNISRSNQKRLEKIAAKYHREIQIINIADVLALFGRGGVNGYSNAPDMGLTTYARLAIADLLPDVRRVIYLDCDTLITGSIGCLAEMDMGGMPAGMACDCLQNRYKKYIGISGRDSYYNSGVMVIDIPKWRENRCKERIFEHILHVRNQYPLVDQDLLNVVLHHDIYRMDMKYNYLSQYFLYGWRGIHKVYELPEGVFYAEQEFAAKEQAVIFHFCGQTFIRPWYKNSRHPLKQEYDKYYAKSPWAGKLQADCKWKLPYKVQYLLWRYSPAGMNAFFGKIMQRLFMLIQYKV